MPKLITITPEKIDKVKDLLTRNTIRGAARYAGVSFYTAWNIAKGNYDKPEPLQQYKPNYSRCPITGFKL